MVSFFLLHGFAIVSRYKNFVLLIKLQLSWPNTWTKNYNYAAQSRFKRGMDRFTIGLFQYTAFFVFLSLLFKSKCHKLEITF